MFSQYPCCTVVTDYFPTKYFHINELLSKAFIHQLFDALYGYILRAIYQTFQHFIKNREVKLHPLESQ